MNISGHLQILIRDSSCSTPTTSWSLSFHGPKNSFFFFLLTSQTIVNAISFSLVTVQIHKTGPMTLTSNETSSQFDRTGCLDGLEVDHFTTKQDRGNSLYSRTRCQRVWWRSIFQVCDFSTIILIFLFGIRPSG